MFTLTRSTSVLIKGRNDGDDLPTRLLNGVLGQTGVGDQADLMGVEREAPHRCVLRPRALEEGGGGRDVTEMDRCLLHA